MYACLMIAIVCLCGCRLEMAIGRDSPLFIPEERIGPARDIATIAETISALRLRYEEIIVRLYVCQNHVQTILRDPVRGTEDNWEDVRQAFGDALESVGVNGGEAELWRKSDIIVNGRSGSGDSGDTVLPQSPERREGQFTRFSDEINHESSF